MRPRKKFKGGKFKGTRKEEGALPNSDSGWRV